MLVSNANFYPIAIHESGSDAPRLVGSLHKRLGGKFYRWRKSYRRGANFATPEQLAAARGYIPSQWLEEIAPNTLYEEPESGAFTVGCQPERITS